MVDFLATDSDQTFWAMQYQRQVILAPNSQVCVPSRVLVPNILVVANKWEQWTVVLKVNGVACLCIAAFSARKILFQLRMVALLLKDFTAC